MQRHLAFFILLAFRYFAEMKNYLHAAFPSTKNDDILQDIAYRLNTYDSFLQEIVIPFTTNDNIFTEKVIPLFTNALICRETVIRKLTNAIFSKEHVIGKWLFGCFLPKITPPLTLIRHSLKR